MTEQFYTKFLEYLSPETKKSLTEKMKKTGVGFMTEKMLKTALVTEGNAALKYVYKKCKTTFQDENEAVEKFSPTTAVECLANALADRF